MRLKSFAAISLSLLAICGCASPPPTEQTMGLYDLNSQRISGSESVTVSGASAFDEVSVLVTVGAKGDVIETKVADGSFKGDASAVVAVAKEWKFRPQTFDGHPIQAIGEITIQLDPPEIAPDSSVPFPVAAPEDVEIILERSACYGTCPDYRVAIAGDGKVRFSTREMSFPGTTAELFREWSGLSVVVPGMHESTVSPNAVAGLLAKFRAAHFMGMKKEYVAAITDSPTYALTLRVGKTTKRVVDYVGKEVGMPAAMTALEDAVDAVAGTDRWVRGNAQTVTLLKARGFDFRSKNAAALIQGVTALNRRSSKQTGAAELIVAAIAEGLDLSAPVADDSRRRFGEAATLGALITIYAVETGNEALFVEMARKGQIMRMDKRALDTAFLSDMGCSASIAKALVKAGANPKAAGEKGNALHALRESYGQCADAGSEKRAEMAKALIALGVPLEARDSIGWTPLMGCNDPAVTLILLKAGANPNAKDGDGTTAILSVNDDRVALTLLRFGADPRVKDENGTLREQARKGHWPATLAWLDAHRSD